MTPAEQAEEWGRRRNLVGTEVRRMYGKRYADYHLSNRGSDLGSKHEDIKRGKVIGVSYCLPALPEFLR